jgi:hypothetical protein
MGLLLRGWGVLQLMRMGAAARAAPMAPNRPDDEARLYESVMSGSGL